MGCFSEFRECFSSSGTESRSIHFALGIFVASVIEAGCPGLLMDVIGVKAEFDYESAEGRNCVCLAGKK